VPKYAKLIKTDGSMSWITPDNRTDFTLQEAYKLLHCAMVEIVYLSNGQLMIVDEEGWLKPGAQVNITATKLYWCQRNTEHLIAGDVIVCDADMFR
jgi:hypothetical protein